MDAGAVEQVFVGVLVWAVAVRVAEFGFVPVGGGPEDGDFLAGRNGAAADFDFAGGYPAVGVPASAPGGSMMASGDPVMDRIQTEIRTLTRDSGPRAELRTGYRERSGEAGLSELKELTGSAEVSTSLGNGRIKARAEATRAIVFSAPPSQDMSAPSVRWFSSSK